MTLERKLKAIFELIKTEVQNNQDFRDRLSEILDVPAGSQKSKITRDSGVSSTGSKRGNRRPPALVDPIFEIQNGEHHLRTLLLPLSMEQLRDVVAEYRMDPNKLVMKWQDREKVINHIMTTAQARGKKGDAFRA